MADGGPGADRGSPNGFVGTVQTGSTVMDFILPVAILVVLAIGLGYYYVKQFRSH